MNIEQTLIWFTDLNHAFGVAGLLALAVWIVLDIVIYGDES